MHPAPGSPATFMLDKHAFPGASGGEEELLLLSINSTEVISPLGISRTQNQKTGRKWQLPLFRSRRIALEFRENERGQKRRKRSTFTLVLPSHHGIAHATAQCAAFLLSFLDVHPSIRVWPGPGTTPPNYLLWWSVELKLVSACLSACLSACVSVSVLSVRSGPRQSSQRAEKRSRAAKNEKRWRDDDDIHAPFPLAPHHTTLGPTSVSNTMTCPNLSIRISFFGLNLKTGLHWDFWRVRKERAERNRANVVRRAAGLDVCSRSRHPHPSSLVNSQCIISKILKFIPCAVWVSYASLAGNEDWPSGAHSHTHTHTHTRAPACFSHASYFI